MRLAVEVEAGLIASSPEETIAAMADIAEADGADRLEWLAKAAAAATHVPVGGEPRFQIVRDVVHRADDVFAIAMRNIQHELADLLGANDER